ATIFRPKHIQMPAAMHADPIIGKRWDSVMDKFNIWSLTNHSKVALVDTDVVFDPKGNSAQQLFEDCAADLCAVRDGDVRFMNAGLIVITPSAEPLSHIQSALDTERHHYDMPEQSFLTRYAQDPKNDLSLMYLDEKWNSCASGGILANTKSTQPPKALKGHAKETSSLLKEACKDPAKDSLKVEVPLDYWAWPQVGIYQILLDRFASPSELKCTDLTDYCGGTLQAAADRMGYIKDLGVDGIVLSPTIENMPKGYHGYWPKDLNAVNHRLGTEQDLKMFIFLAHQNGMRVVADVNLNHAGSPGVNGTNFADIASLSPFNDSSYYHSDECSLWVGSDFDSRDLERCSLFGMADYKHEDQRVWDGLMDWVRDHVDNFGFDGIRVDAARHIPQEFLNHLLGKGAPVPAYYEVPGGDLKQVSSYSVQDLSAVYNYPLYYKLRDIFVPGQNQTPMTSLASMLTTQGSRVLFNFLDNNDLPRFIRLLGSDRALYHSALSYLCMAPGVPIILYGAEQSVQGPGTSMDPMKEEQAHLWRPPLWESGYSSSSEEFKLLKGLLWLRKHYEGFHQFTPQVLISDESTLAFLRGEVLVFLTNRPWLDQSRIIWGNSSFGCKTVELCSFFSQGTEIRCMDFTPEGYTQVDITDATPLIMVPRSVLNKYKADQVEENVERVSRQADHQQDVPHQEPPGKTTLQGVDFNKGQWQLIPDPPALKVETVPRFSRAGRQPGVSQEDPSPQHNWTNSSQIPAYLDIWYPSLESLPMQAAHANISNACVVWDSKSATTFVARRLQHSYVMCCSDFDHGSEFCTRSLLLKIERPSGFIKPSRDHALRRALQVPVDLQETVINGSIVFLSRGNNSRTISNEQAVVEALRELGRRVEVIYAEPTNFEKTIQTLAGAELVIGPHGANLVNMMFAPVGAKVLEIVPLPPFRMTNYHYRTMAAALGFTYLPLSQTVLHYNKTLAVSQPDMAIDSFSVDPGRVKAAAASLLQPSMTSLIQRDAPGSKVGKYGRET
ncbi:unnamed protein product, partial [Polarella glacialis]